LANLLAAAALGITDAVQQVALEMSGLDLVAATALVALLDAAPNGSLRRLSQAVGISHSGTVRLVDRLAGAGLVNRQQGQDQRSRAVTLTRAGRRVAVAIRKQRQAAVLDVLDGLSEPRRAQLVRACEQLVANLARQRLARRLSGSSPVGGMLCRFCDFTDCGRAEGRCPAAGVAATPGLW
jgi:MarR family transcriptional repressor of emrRAB